MASPFRARGVLRTAAVWGITVSALASTLLVVGVEVGLVPGTVFGIPELVQVAVRNALFGALAGAAFAMFVARRERSRAIAELTYARIAIAGAAGTILVTGGLFAIAPHILPVAVMIAGGVGLGLIGAALGATTLAIARRTLPERDRLSTPAKTVYTLPPVT
jgi:hypothetical protein